MGERHSVWGRGTACGGEAQHVGGGAQHVGEGGHSMWGRGTACGGSMWGGAQHVGAACGGRACIVHFLPNGRVFLEEQVHVHIKVGQLQAPCHPPNNLVAKVNVQLAASSVGGANLVKGCEALDPSPEVPSSQQEVYTLLQLHILLLIFPDVILQSGGRFLAITTLHPLLQTHLNLLPFSIQLWLLEASTGRLLGGSCKHGHGSLCNSHHRQRSKGSQADMRRTQQKSKVMCFVT